MSKGTLTPAGRSKLPKLQLLMNEVARSQAKYDESLDKLNELIKESFPNKPEDELITYRHEILDSGDNLRLVYDIENSLLNIKKKADKNKYTAELGSEYLFTSKNSLLELIAKTSIINKVSKESQEASEVFNDEYFSSMDFDELVKAINNDLIDLPEDMQNGWLNSFFLQIDARIDMLFEMHDLIPNEAPSIEFVIDIRKQVKAIESFYIAANNGMTPAEEMNKSSAPGRPQKPQSFIVCRSKSDLEHAYNQYKAQAKSENAAILTAKEVLEQNLKVINTTTGRIALTPLEKAMSDRYKTKNLIEDLTQQLKIEKKQPVQKPKIGRTAKPLPDRISELKKKVKKLTKFIDNEVSKARETGELEFNKTLLTVKKAERRDLRYGLKRLECDPNITLAQAKSNGESSVSIKMRQELIDTNKEIADISNTISSLSK
ncbi:hypothetical protein I3271_09400 [Photobacterium leiognathi]|uniref:hypothetical protein n=1 Tax=Photobacterium leiognathi TaxID=553611 RepID=UPI001EDE699F|nr:hypothetical protein [Photobacterium leiognathi]MCG3884902.1 hypothetical protein [Photobacterium leiognathi]